MTPKAISGRYITGMLALWVAVSWAACGGAPPKKAVGGDPIPEEEEEEEKKDASASGGKGGQAGSPSVDARMAAGGSAGSSMDAGALGGSAGADAGRDSGGGVSTDTAVVGPTTNFSFFVTSIEAMRELSKSQNGFGGDLRFGEPTGLQGADKICRTIAEKALPGAGQKTWRAFLSASAGGPDGGPVHAIDRVGEGPWYDRMGRVVAMNKEGLIAGPRPQGPVAVVNDLPNENGIPNKQGTDNHDTLTGSNRMGRHPTGAGPGINCNNWTSSVGSTGRPQIGHSWPRNPGSLSNGGQWISDHLAPGCAPGVNIGSGFGGGATVGGGGGYGGLYCFALATP